LRSTTKDWRVSSLTLIRRLKSSLTLQTCAH